MTELILPIGVLRTSPEDAPRVELNCDPVRRRVLRDWFERVGDLHLPWIAVPQAIDNSPAGLTLEYSSSLNESTSVAAQIPEWTEDAAVALPQVIGLGRFTLLIAEELTKHKIDGVAVCPALVHHYPTGPEVWRLVVLPTANATRADWARSDAGFWLWSAPTALTAGGTADPVHTLGAAIHHALTGGLFANALPDEEKFARLLRGNIGMPEKLAEAVLACAPKSCQPDAEKLRQLVLDCLDARPGKRPTEADTRTRFDAIEKRLGFDRLARSWEGDDRTDTSDELRRRAAAAPQLPRPPETPEDSSSPKEDWSDTARRAMEKGDLTAALAAAWKAVFTEGPAKIELYLVTVQRSAAVLPPPRAEIVGALARLDHAYSAELVGEANMLRVAHIRLRYLSAPPEEVAPLLKTTKSEWTRATGLLLQAFLRVRKGEGYADASRLCREGRTIFARMPNGGGEFGKYGRAYLALLDGIAHVGFVASGGPPAYYTDALSQFSDALQLAAEVGARDLFRASGRWLTWLAWLAGLTPGPDATTIRIATDALLRLHNLTGAGHGLHETPDVPWYDEVYIFPV